MLTTGLFLSGWIMRAPYPLVPTILTTIFVLLLFGPAFWGFVAAWRWGRKAGFSALILAYFCCLWIGCALLFAATACRAEPYCNHRPPAGPDAGWEFLKWAAEAYAISWPWHLAWLLPSAAGVWAGLRVRRRRSIATA